MLDIYINANIFPLKFRRKYFMLNLIHRLLNTGQIVQVVVQRATRQNSAPVLQQYVPQNDTIAKSPVFVARGYWNALPVHIRNTNEHTSFKDIVRNRIREEYITEERARLAAGQF